jgi:hypothetical protein
VNERERETRGREAANEAAKFAELQADRDLLRWLHAEAVWREQDLTRQRDAWWEVQSRRVGALIVERDKAAASRQAWAEEAMRLHEVLLHLSTELGEAGMDHLAVAAAAQLSDPRCAVHPDGQTGGTE